jgi:hypothetical protein
MIPVVDQVTDIRDLAAAIKKLVIDERYDELWVWFDFDTTLPCLSRKSQNFVRRQRLSE